MVTYGFFNSLDGDRKYNADQVSAFWDAVMTNGVFNGYKNGMQVVPGTGMQVQVSTGRAMVDHHWVDIDAPESLTIGTAHPTFDRIDSIVLKCDYIARAITAEVVAGTAASNPTPPALNSTSDTVYMRLANVRVTKNTATIPGSAISDNRGSEECPWVTGLIEQVDTATLFTQWKAAYDENTAEMNEWEADKKSDFEDWMATLTEQLQIGAYIERDVKTGYTDDSTQYTNFYTGATKDDIYDLYINGIHAKQVESDKTPGAGQWRITNFKELVGIIDVEINCRTMQPYEFVVTRSVLGVKA